MMTPLSTYTLAMNRRPKQSLEIFTSFSQYWNVMRGGRNGDRVQEYVVILCCVYMSLTTHTQIVKFFPISLEDLDVLRP